MNLNPIHKMVRDYYDNKLQTHGVSPKGVDWNSPESQILRFEQLLSRCDINKPFTINDYGCGYGALVEHLNKKGCDFKYRGFDISEDMVSHAKELHQNCKECDFITDESQFKVADYTIASGIFNVKLSTPDDEWLAYILNTLENLTRISREGFSFNLLTKYSDQEYMRPDLYYADPLLLFDHCKQKYSRYVSLIHDYPLYEFTIFVKKDEEKPWQK